MTKHSTKEGEQETLYTYYEVEIQGTSLDWDITICESLDHVRDILQYLDTFLDDPEIEAKVIITGIGLTRSAYENWKKEHLEN
jgi:hypothetical protein